MSGIGDLDNLISMLDERAKRRKAELKPKDASPAAPADALRQLAGLGAALVEATNAAEALRELREKHDELQDALSATRKQLATAKELAARQAEIEQAATPVRSTISRDGEGLANGLLFECGNETRRLSIVRDRAGKIRALTEPPAQAPIATIVRDANGRIQTVELRP